MGWAKGDLALLVRADPWRSFDGCRLARDSHPRPGGVYTVDDVLSDDDGLFLSFDEFADWYQASCFRRIAPLTDSERRQALADLGERVVERVS